MSCFKGTAGRAGLKWIRCSGEVALPWGDAEGDDAEGRRGEQPDVDAEGDDAEGEAEGRPRGTA